MLLSVFLGRSVPERWGSRYRCRYWYTYKNMYISISKWSYVLTNVCLLFLLLLSCFQLNRMIYILYIFSFIEKPSNIHIPPQFYSFNVLLSSLFFVLFIIVFTNFVQFSFTFAALSTNPNPATRCLQIGQRSPKGGERSVD